MQTYQVSQDIKAPPGTVWKFVSDVFNWPERLPNYNAVTALNDQDFQVGSRFRVSQPKLLPAIWEVTSCRENEGFTWQSCSMGLAMKADHLIRVTGLDTCELTLKFCFSGLLAIFAGPLAGKLVRRYLSIEAHTFKNLAEKANA
jgi:uncharacterized membrane protein